MLLAAPRRPSTFALYSCLCCCYSPWPWRQHSSTTALQEPLHRSAPRPDTLLRQRSVSIPFAKAVRNVLNCSSWSQFLWMHGVATWVMTFFPVVHWQTVSANVHPLELMPALKQLSWEESATVNQYIDSRSAYRTGRKVRSVERDTTRDQTEHDHQERSDPHHVLQLLKRMTCTRGVSATMQNRQVQTETQEETLDKREDSAAISCTGYRPRAGLTTRTSTPSEARTKCPQILQVYRAW